MNLTEEQLKLLVNTLMPAFMKEFVNYNHLTIDSYERICQIISRRINELQYDIDKDRIFMLSYLGKLSNVDIEEMYDVYNTYSEQYDKFNKHALNDTESE